jgi:hypothetical protein
LNFSQDTVCTLVFEKNQEKTYLFSKNGKPFTLLVHLRGVWVKGIFEMKGAKKIRVNES